jgi:serine/threonine protein kinase/tetratricopeptide (TPR) repeat protein
VSPEEIRKARQLASTALTMSAQDRASYLAQETQGNTELLEETQLLIEDEQATRGLTEEDETMPMGPTGGRAQARGPQFADEFLAGKKQIGNYKLLRSIGQGGMGMVYSACLVTEDFQRQVALKLVKPSLASSQILRRFRMERQLLASLDHPNIARLLDAGTSEEGAPYLVMEYVEGLPIDRYCEAQKLSITDRLKLFATVCDAVQYAHQNLIIHRDLKPSNILVSSEGTPKLLDFGIAKLIRPEDSDEEELKLTATDARPMSPHYASPEQASGGAITTSSDIYSLGVLLYELLTGNLPYDFKVRTPAGIEKTICETEPVPPSQVEIKGTRPEPADKLRKRLHGDLDMILLMAMRKEPQRRYSSVHQFAEDIRRQIDGLPVIAQSDTFGYRLSKFVNRHKAGVAAAIVAVIALISSTVVSVHFARQANREKIIAQQRFQDTRDLARFFITDFDSKIRAGQTAARRELVSKGLDYLKRLSVEAAGDVELQREVISGYITMGDVQGNPFGPNLGDNEGARRSYGEALRLADVYISRTASTPDLQRDRALAKVKLADLDAVGGNRRQSLRAYREALSALKGKELAGVLNKLGYAGRELGDYKAALDDYGKSADLLRDLLSSAPKDNDVRTLLAQASLGIGETFARINQVDSALASFDSAIKIYEDLLRADTASNTIRRALSSAYTLTGDTLTASKRHTEAEQRFRESLKIVEILTRNDPDNVQYRLDRVTVLGRLVEALTSQPAKRAEARAVTAQFLSSVRPMVERPEAGSYEMQYYTWILLTTPFGDLKQPKQALDYALRLQERSGANDPSAIDLVARAYFGMGDFKRAVETEEKALSLLPKDFLDSAVRREFEANLRQFKKAAGQ